MGTPTVNALSAILFRLSARLLVSGVPGNGAGLLALLTGMRHVVFAVLVSIGLLSTRLVRIRALTMRWTATFDAVVRLRHGRMKCVGLIMT